MDETHVLGVILGWIAPAPKLHVYLVLMNVTLPGNKVFTDGISQDEVMLD